MRQDWGCCGGSQAAEKVAFRVLLVEEELWVALGEGAKHQRCCVSALWWKQWQREQES